MSFDIIIQLISLVCFFLALSVHEFSHALSAFYLGDKTAEDAGRLTLNPLAHIDLFGTIILPLFLFLAGSPVMVGWAKPVPVNFNNLRNQKWGPAIVSLAGPFANLVFGLFCLILLKLVYAFSSLGPNNLLINFLAFLVMINFVLMIFNLMPIPPLDGSNVLFAFLPDKFANFKAFLTRYGFFILIIFLLFFSSYLDSIYYFIYRFLM